MLIGIAAQALAVDGVIFTAGNAKAPLDMGRITNV
jgi:hypothetical protein